MAGTLHFLGIYPNDIEHAADVLEAVCEEHGVDKDALYDYILQEFEETYGDQFGNRIIDLMFHNLKSWLVNDGIPSTSIDYEVNGMCSDFYINGEQAY